MKKTLAISLSLAMMLTLVACGGGSKNDTTASDEPSSYEDVVTTPESDMDSTLEEESEEPSDEEADSEDEEAAEEKEQKPEEEKKPAEEKPAAKPESKPAAKPAAKPEHKPAPKPAEKPAASKNYSGSLSGLVDAIYAKHSVDLSLATMPLDLNDADAMKYYLGLTDSSKLKEAVVSESMIGSQPYSMAVVRVKNAADSASIAKAMFNGIDQAKWICVTADSLAVGAYGDTIMLIMVSSEYGKTLHTDLRAAYASAVGASKLDASMDRFNPNAVPQNAMG